MSLVFTVAVQTGLVPDSCFIRHCVVTSRHPVWRTRLCRFQGDEASFSIETGKVRLGATSFQFFGRLYGFLKVLWSKTSQIQRRGTQLGLSLPIGVSFPREFLSFKAIGRCFLRLAQVNIEIFAVSPGGLDQLSRRRRSSWIEGDEGSMRSRHGLTGSKRRKPGD